MASRTTGTGALPRRIFIALIPPAELLSELGDLIDPLAIRWPQLHWSPAANWHITLAFLARVTPDELSRLTDQLTDLAARTASFNLHLSGAGAFPAPALGRALWLGVAEESGALDRLAADARRATGRAGVRADDASFLPHLTIARVGIETDLRLQIGVLEPWRSSNWHVDQLAIVESRLGQGVGGGPRYEVLQRFALARH